ncbi:MAG: CHAT domain-containing protein, partial [Endomicrobium sp.]|nr:CHAT domain-containing protein [Endomicrobium sp.]
NEGVDYNNIGAVYKTAGQWQKAIASFDNAYEIAKEVGNRRDEAIALNNRALLEKLTGYTEAALKDYQAALALYREVGFMEGVATTLIGLADMDTDNYQYQAALEKLLQAKDIYEKQGLVFQLARIYVQLGELYKKTVRPPTTTRDLVFEDDEITVVSLDISSDEALRISDEYFAKAEKIAERYSLNNLLWKAFQGRAFVLKQSGDFVKAEQLYEKAINMVLSMKGFEENSELLLNYLKDKDDLFTEAIDVCNSLYHQTQDESYLRKQMEYDEIYRNEIVKTNMQMANIEYTDPEKRSLFDSMKQLDAQRKKADKAAQAAAVAAEAPKSSKAAKIASEQAQEESKLLKEQFEKYLAELKENYPQETIMFDSAYKVVLKDLRETLKDDQAIIQYIPLDDKLLIFVLTKEGIYKETVNKPYMDLAKLISKDFIGVTIEHFGHFTKISTIKREECSEQCLYDQSTKQLLELTDILYNPIQKYLKQKNRLNFITSKYLSYVPFSALIIGEVPEERNEKGNIIKVRRPKYLIEEKVISYVRLSFLDKAFNKSNIHFNRNTISIGNPDHIIMTKTLGNIPNAEMESNSIKSIINKYSPNTSFANFVNINAKKDNFIKAISDNKYGIMHFAAHGVPFSEVIFTQKGLINKIKNSKKITEEDRKNFQLFVKYTQQIFTNNSHFNGFLLLAAEENDLKKNADIDLELQKLLNLDKTEFESNYIKYIESLTNNNTGLLTIRDIVNMNDDLFSEAYLVLLSACNTAVTFTPKVLASTDYDLVTGYTELSKKDYDLINQEMKTLGWTPGIDETCFVDIFMYKNFQYVYGTVWFAHDESSSQIMQYFMENLYSGNSADPPEALAQAIRMYLEVKAANINKDDFHIPLHPFYWAVGNIFGI